jgi:hypothetical protein
MGWDIYGERLTPGHCEVHPWVAQGYPCSICDIENERDQVNRKQFMDAEREYYEQMEQDHRHSIAYSGNLKYRILCWVNGILDKLLKKINAEKKEITDNVVL